MRKRHYFLIVCLAFLGCSTQQTSQVERQKAPYGGLADVQFAKSLWAASKKLNFVGKDSIRTAFYQGTHPHGMVLELLEKENVSVQSERGVLVIKKNYGGESDSGNMVKPKEVQNDPERYLKAVTIMFQRHSKYDKENGNWFYAKYSADGTLEMNAQKKLLAGRVGKGEAIGCISCHRAAPGGDFIFKHDRYK